MTGLPYTRFDPDDMETWPPFMTHCVATWLEKGKPRFSGCAVLGIGGWLDVLHQKDGVVTRKKKIEFDPGSLGWFELTPPDWWTKKEGKKE